MNHTEALSSKLTEVISALTIEDAEVAEKETTQNTISTADHGLDQIVTISNYNTLTKLLSVTAYILRFLHNCRNLANKLTKTITPSERKQANLLWILDTQQVITN